jgi:hypothetical protein
MPTAVVAKVLVSATPSVGAKQLTVKGKKVKRPRGMIFGSHAWPDFNLSTIVANNSTSWSCKRTTQQRAPCNRSFVSHSWLSDQVIDLPLSAFTVSRRIHSVPTKCLVIVRNGHALGMLEHAY